MVLKICEYCKIWGFHGGDYDDYHFLGDDNHHVNTAFYVPFYMLEEVHNMSQKMSCFQHNL
jgi:hypothetical protein